MKLEDLQPDDPEGQELEESDKETEKCHDYKIKINVDKEGRVVLKSNHLSVDDFIVGPTLGTGSYGRVKLVRLKNKPEDLFALKMLKKYEILKRNQL